MFRDEDSLNAEEEYYLHGKCDKWAIKNFKSGDLIVAYMEIDDDIGVECLLHCFIKRGKTFLDVRGSTENESDILDGFDYGEYSVKTFKSAEEFKAYLRRK